MTAPWLELKQLVELMENNLFMMILQHNEGPVRRREEPTEVTHGNLLRDRLFITEAK